MENVPVSINELTRTQLDAELQRGIESIQSEKTYTTDEVDAELKKEFGI